jgi:hypothetical protein
MEGMSVSLIKLKAIGHINAYFDPSIYPFFDNILKTPN